MKIILTGGTGFLGKRLAKEMIRRHATVSILSRQEDEELKNLGAKFFIGDVLNKGTLIEAFAGQDVVYHLAAELDESSPDLWRINVGGAKVVTEVCRLAGIKRLIYPSSIGVMGSSEGELTEDSPYNPETMYEKTKADAEEVIINSGVPYTIARMPPILGANSIWRQIFLAAEKGYPIIGPGNNFWPLVYIDDVIDALLRMLRPNARNQIYNITNGERHTYKEVYDSISGVLGIPAQEKHIPLWLANFGALVYETKCRILGKKPKVTMMRASIKRLTSNRQVSIEKAKSEIDYAPRYSLAEGLRKTWERLKEFEGK